MFISVAIFAPASACLLLALWLRCRRRTQGKIDFDFDFDFAYSGAIKKKKNLQSSTGNEEQTLELKLYEMSTIRAATSDFSMENLLGEGGFGPVYKVID